MSGDNMLGMIPIGSSVSPLEIVPLPRLLNHQLDFYIESRVAAIEKEVLTELQSHILDRNSYDWFGIFLAIYIYLTGLESDLWNLETWEHDAEILRDRVRELVGHFRDFDLKLHA